MGLLEAADEYAQALRQGQKEYRELLMSGRTPHPAVLDELLPEVNGDFVQNVGLVEIPAAESVPAWSRCHRTGLAGDAGTAARSVASGRIG